MRNRFILITVLFLSCSTPLPKDVLPPEQMKIVLWDVLRADELADYKLMTDTSLNRIQTYIGYYQEILNIHRISREKFRKSLVYYENHPGLFKVVLDSLQNYADRQQKADSLHQEKPSHPVSVPQNLRLSIDSLKKRKQK
ncbi:MAG: DUF4296 domain-containing protein [Flavisolibacter sp.]|jgi:hypothetical protein